jgi:hypothetical protein
MNRIRNYFHSFDSFIQLLSGIRRRMRESYWRIFHRSLDRAIKNLARKEVSNESFLARVGNILSIPADLAPASAYLEAVLNESDRVTGGIYDILGSGERRLDPVDWHTDFKTGSRWDPGKFYKDYIQEGIETDSDVKVPRELSRCHHLLKCGIAAKISGNEKYASFCHDQIVDWIDQNPLMFSINWGCTMDVSIRAVNWIWTLGMIQDYNKAHDLFVEKIKVSLYQHGWFIYRNPEKRAYNNHNHYLADLAGQIHLGLIFNELEEPKRWLEEGKRELFREIRLQILPSGVSYERSTNYNRLVLELILFPVLLLKKEGHEIPPDIWFRISRMFEFILYSTKPDGTTPVIGDQDNGRLLPFGCEPLLDFRYLLSLGAILFSNSGFKQGGDGFNIYCRLLGGPYAKEKWEKLPDKKQDLDSKSFPDAGFYIMRKDNNYLFMNVSGKSLYPELGSGTHTHSDLLSFELVSDGKTFLVDPGSYVYSADADERMRFRSTKMHNTVTVDGESQNILRREVLWDFERNAIPEVLSWSSVDKNDTLSAGHSGYCRLKDPVKHLRTVLFGKERAVWNISDRLSGAGKHLVEWHFHFDDGIDFEVKGEEINTICPDGNNISMTFKGINDLKLRKEDAHISKSYGVKTGAKVLVIEAFAELPVELETIIKKAYK